ncbi:MAG: hypothetical protein IKY44_00550 [Clostridia bacterium]|nr:hypothetical protein [Clostridia bacterium]
MKIEILFPELSNIFGDFSNVKLLSQTLKDVEFIHTSNLEKPYFLDNDVDMVYVGSMPESKQELAIQRLMPYKNELWQAIENGLVMLATGNAMEIFISHIIDGDRKIDALGFFDMYAVRNFENRHNSHFVGNFDDIKIVGYKSQFTMCYGENKHPFIDVVGGCGINLDSKQEGIRYKNFFATYLLGPFLVLNPYFTKYLLNKIGYNGALAFEKQAIDAYDYRLNELIQKGHFLMGEHG